ncbi:MAG: DUF4097 family beta strand repeat protein [Spirochaetales bacterium]|nr:DUF4097 family beta strand repeat protein [Spirochaetales bacterium]MBR6347556.1 DUF4097 family beta strand repeat protein [Spirochaetales bacterium]
MKKAFPVILLAVLVLVCGCRKTLSVLGNTYKDAAKYTAGNLTYRASDVDAVSICYNSGNLTLVQSDSQNLNVTESGNKLSEDQKVHWFMDGRTLRIQFAKSGYTGSFPVNSKNLTVEIPAVADLEIVLTSGDAEIRGNLEAGNFTFVSTSGNLRASEIRTGAFSIGSTSGDSNIDAVYAKSAKLAATSGNIGIGYLSAETVSHASTSGSFSTGLASCSSFKAAATSGNIYITSLPPGGATLKYSHTSGDLKADGYTVKGDRMVFGNGSCSMEIDTTSGNLTIDDMKYALFITLDSNPTTGCSWRVEIKDPTIVRFEGSEYVPDNAPAGMTGTGGKETLRLRGLKEGTTTAEFIYGHAWAPDEVYDRFTAVIRVNRDLSLTATYPVSE